MKYKKEMKLLTKEDTNTNNDSNTVTNTSSTEAIERCCNSSNSHEGNMAVNQNLNTNLQTNCINVNNCEPPQQQELTNPSDRQGYFSAANTINFSTDNLIKDPYD